MHLPEVRRAAVAAIAAVVAMGLTGCVGLPTTGPVREGAVPEREPAAPLTLPEEPIADGTPEDIVQGFLRAGAAGLSDDFRAARTHLTSGATWEPQAQVLISGAPPQLRYDNAGTVIATVPVAAIVDGSGAYAEVAARTPQVLEFELVQDATDQWRISSAPQGVVMSPRDFEQLYRDVPVYFASPDLTHLVPDLRHFPARNIETLAARALFAGPSLWLRDAVESGIPEGAQLTVSAVTVEETVATVDLAAPAIRAETNRNLLQVQLEATLRGLPTVITEVLVTVGGLPWENQRGGIGDLIINPPPVAGPFVLLDDGRIAVVEQGEVLPLADVASLEGLSANSLALSPDVEVRVVRSGTSRILLLPAGGAEPVELIPAPDDLIPPPDDLIQPPVDLIPPSVDRFGWVWSGPEASAGTLLAVTADGVQTEITADWLEGSEVRSLRVARDGTRVAVVSTDESGRVSVDVAGVVRDGLDRPLRLGERWQIGASLVTASEVSWVDEVTVAVLGTTSAGGSAAMHRVPLGGVTSALSIVENAKGIATGRGDRALYLVDLEGQLWLRQGQVWRPAATGVSDVVFPG